MSDSLTERRRIKVIVSDFHLGFGRSTPDGAVNDLEDFISDQAFIDMLEHYRTGDYADAEVEMVLNGDTFEGLTTIDPHERDGDLITASKSVAKISRILDGHAEMFAALRVFAMSEQRRVTFLVGNHDQDLLWDEVQALLRARIHERVQVLLGPYRFDGVHVEHGNQYETHNRFDLQKLFLTRQLAEPILNLPWGSDMFLNCVLKLKRARPYINRVRPFKLAVYWSFWHDLRLLLRGALLFLLCIVRARFRTLRQRRIPFLRTLRILFGISAYPTLEDGARDIVARYPGTRIVVFGHTHLPLSRQLTASSSYYNSGSWIPNSNLHIASLGRSLMQTFVHVDCGSSPTARLKVWHGRRVLEEDVVL